MHSDDWGSIVIELSGRHVRVRDRRGLVHIIDRRGLIGTGLRRWLIVDFWRLWYYALRGYIASVGQRWFGHVNE